MTKATLNAEVSYRDVKFGKGTATIGIEVDREHTKLDRFDAIFTNAELEVTLTRTPADVEQGQELIDGTEPVPFTGMARTGSFTTDAEKFAVSLSFKKTDKARELLADFARQKGSIKVKRIGDAKDDAPGQMKLGNEGEGAEHEDAA